MGLQNGISLGAPVNMWSTEKNKELVVWSAFFCIYLLRTEINVGMESLNAFFASSTNVATNFRKRVISQDFHLFSIVQLVFCFWLDKNTGEFFSDSPVNFLKTLDKLLFTDLKDIFLFLVRSLS